MAKCGAKTEIYSRVVGYFRPVANWNIGKKQEFKDRKNYQIPKLSTKPALREGEK
jgi:ribonucleoside-triphosphate reductase